MAAVGVRRLHCVGMLCSIERLFDELSELTCSALDPLQVTKSGVLTVAAECRRDPKSLFALIYINRLVFTAAGRLHMDSKLLHAIDFTFY